VALLTSVTARPLWKEFDPVEVLYAWEKEEAEPDQEDGETLLSLVR
jgi:hypothetical protein